MASQRISSRVGVEQTKAKVKKKAHKKKADGMSNWKSLCSSLQISSSRKNSAVKRKQDQPSEVLDPKKAKPEVWFDNVDEILLEHNPEETSIPDLAVGSKNSKLNPDGGNGTDDKLVKADSFSGLTNCVAMDCEMVGTGPTGEESVLARVSIVNHFGVCLYDKFVLPREEVTDYRTHVSGVTKDNLATGEEFTKVQKEVSDILKGRTLVGHAVHNDLKVLFLTHPHSDIRDTSKYKPFRELFGGRNPALKKLTNRLLNVAVQEGQHSSVQDAQATMRLYTMHRQRWEKEINERRKHLKKKHGKKKKTKQVS